MSENSGSFLHLSTAQNQPSLFWAALIVIVMHIVLLAVGKHWTIESPKPKEQQKVIVQTISLKAEPPTIVKIQSPPLQHCRLHQHPSTCHYAGSAENRGAKAT